MNEVSGINGSVAWRIARWLGRPYPLLCARAAQLSLHLATFITLPLFPLRVVK